MVSISHPPNNSSILIQVPDIQNVSLEDEKAILVYTTFSLSLSYILLSGVRDTYNKFYNIIFTN